MANSRPKKPKVKKPHQGRSRLKPKPSLWTIPRKIGAGAAGVIAFFAAVVTFFPRITVQVSGPFDPSNEASVSFKITNNSVFPVTDLTTWLVPCDLLATGAKGFPALIYRGPSTAAEYTTGFCFSYDAARKKLVRFGGDKYNYLK